MKPQDIVQPGDCLLYSGSGLWSWLIKLKTWGPVSHSEVYIGNGQTVTSREGQGVNFYAFTDEHLYVILRPETPINMTAALTWFTTPGEDGRTPKGQPYGYWQALRFFRLGKEDTARMMCSPCCTRFYRKGDVVPFAPSWDASLVSPKDFLASPHFTEVWRRPVAA